MMLLSSIERQYRTHAFLFESFKYGLKEFERRRMHVTRILDVPMQGWFYHHIHSASQRLQTCSSRNKNFCKFSRSIRNFFRPQFIIFSWETLITPFSGEVAFVCCNIRFTVLIDMLNMDAISIMVSFRSFPLTLFFSKPCILIVIHP